MALASTDFMKVVYRKGTPDDPFLPQTEVLKVVRNKVQLKEIPDSLQKVRVKTTLDAYLNETKSLTPTVNQYRVDYNTGEVFFNELNDGKTFVFSYYGRGMVLINAQRVINEQDETILKEIRGLTDTDVNITRTDGRITRVDELRNGTVVKSTILEYADGKLSSVTEQIGTGKVKTDLVYENGQFKGVQKHVL